jgi:cytochrome c2
MKCLLTRLAAPAMLLALPLSIGLALRAPSAAVAAGEHPGQTVFLAQKCDMCHSIDALAIAATTKSDKMKGPDLSNAAARSAEWTAKWLQRQEQVDGKTHKKEWKGTDEELANLVAFLGTLKDA